MRLSAAFAAASMTAEERPGLETPPGLRFGATAQLWAGHAGAASDRRLAVVLVVYRFTSRFSGVGPRKPGFIVISPPGACRRNGFLVVRGPLTEVFVACPRHWAS